MIQIKPISTLLFSVLLIGWVHFTSSQPPSPSPPQDPYINFVHRLERAINAISPDDLPFGLKRHVIPNLMSVSDEFKRLCYLYDNKQSSSSANSPLIVLSSIIDHIFGDYVRSARDSHLLRILESIKANDPIGFHVHLTQNNVLVKRKASQRFVLFAIAFQEIAINRVRLFNMKTNNSCFDNFDESNSATPYNFLPQRIDIPDIARAEITTEYGPLSDVSINLFTDIVSANIYGGPTRPLQMYRYKMDNVNNYQKHFSSEVSDVQILYDISSRPHAICIYYEPIQGKVHVYDSLMRGQVDDKQMAIIQKLYPFNRETLFKKLKVYQHQPYPTGAIFAIMYASTLLLGKDPCNAPIKRNNDYGDETLYMRIHILNMLANRKFALLE